MHSATAFSTLAFGCVHFVGQPAKYLQHGLLGRVDEYALRNICGLAKKAFGLGHFVLRFIPSTLPAIKFSGTHSLLSSHDCY